ncbi:IS256 family transposase [Streptomyces sp. NPDC046978]|uniref:IS256 family transposase n=1 Tax=Streptomyces sp. NPDC046978 TaxID=3154704 RepID=UPI0033F4417E
MSVVNVDGTTEAGSLIDDIVREGARRMLAAAREAEANAYIAELADHRDEHGRRLVVRNGYHQARKVTTAAGTVEFKAQRLNDKRADETTGERKRSSSVILPLWCRKSPNVSEVLPVLFLRGLRSGDFVPTLEQFVGSAAGLSPATGTRLIQQWRADHVAFGERDLSTSDYVYFWADGIHLHMRLPEVKSWVLVLMGVRADGTKELIAMNDDYRESADSWADLLPDRVRRGMRDPVLAIGDGAQGFWKALGEVFPEARYQRCWIHKIANVANALPKSAQSGAKETLQKIYNAEDRDDAFKAVNAFAEPVESTFAAVRPRTKATLGAGGSAGASAMVFQFVESAQQRWRAVNAPHLVALVRAGARFERGPLVERPKAAA